MNVRRNVVVPVLALAVGFGAGAGSGIRTRTATQTRTVTRLGFPADCGRALTLAGDGLGSAQQALALARSAVQAPVAPASSSSDSSRSSEGGAVAPPSTAGFARAPSDSIFGEGMSRLLLAQRQYLEARSACQAVVDDIHLGERSQAPATTGLTAPARRR